MAQKSTATLTEAARRKGVHRSTIGRAIDRGEMTGIRAGGRTVGVALDASFLAWQPRQGVRRPGSRKRLGSGPAVLSLTEAASAKDCCHGTVINAVRASDLNPVYVARRRKERQRRIGIIADSAFDAWQPDRTRNPYR